MSDLDNVFFLWREGIKKTKENCRHCRRWRLYLPASFLRGYALWKSGTPRVNRAPYSVKPAQDCDGRRKAIYVARPRAYVASLSLTPCRRKAGHKRSFSAHSHCGGRRLARFSFVGTAVAFKKCSFAAAAQVSPPLRPFASA